MVNRQEGTEIFCLELPEMVPFTFGDKPVNQGDFVQLTCNVRRGDKPLSLTWSLICTTYPHYPGKEKWV